MIASALANIPRWSGRGFEIWFFVVLVPDPERALWVRLTRFRDDDCSDARVWAVVSNGGTVTAQREIHPLEAMTCSGTAADVCVRVAEAQLGHGSSSGRCGHIAWQLAFEAADRVVDRMPTVPAFVPVGTRAVHPHAEAAVTGFIELDGQRLSLDGGLLTQMHIWGRSRVEWLRWAWVPRMRGVAGEDQGQLELTCVAPKAGKGKICSLWARLCGETFDRTGLLAALRAELVPVRPGVLHHVATRGGMRLVVRVWADPSSFAGWDYRQIGGGALHVAQSNLAQCEVELYRRAGLGWRPERKLHSCSAALEFHGPDDYPEFSYVGWTEREPRTRARAGESVGDPVPVPVRGTWIDTPAPSNIIALGLTYRAHARETGGETDPVVFHIDPAAWSASERELLQPSSKRLLEALASVESDLPAVLREAGFGFMPAMLDYEAELGLLLLDGLADPEAIADLETRGRVALLLVNDVTARSVQILGEGQPDRLSYWTAAKSLPGFSPTSSHAFVPARFDLDAWPALRLETRVNGVVRQEAALDLLIETPRQMLKRVYAAMGPLAAGTLISTGTPAGVAFSVPRWKRVLGELMLDRFGKLRAALGIYSASADFLRPGDVVQVRAGWLGTLERVIGSEP